MPLMDRNDYFIREGTLTWINKGASLDVSVDLFDRDIIFLRIYSSATGIFVMRGVPRAGCMIQPTPNMS